MVWLLGIAGLWLVAGCRPGGEMVWLLGIDGLWLVAGCKLAEIITNFWNIPVTFH